MTSVTSSDKPAGWLGGVRADTAGEDLMVASGRRSRRNHIPLAEAAAYSETPPRSRLRRRHSPGQGLTQAPESPGKPHRAPGPRDRDHRRFLKPRRLGTSRSRPRHRCEGPCQGLADFRPAAGSSCVFPLGPACVSVTHVPCAVMSSTHLFSYASCVFLLPFTVRPVSGESPHSIHVDGGRGA